MYVAERHFKNEDVIKDKIVEGHRRGVCDKNGASIRTINVVGQRIFAAKPRTCSSSAKTYVYRNGKMVLKEYYG